MNDIQTLNALHASPAAGAAAMDPRAVKVAKDFEAVLLNKLMEAMQATIPESGLVEDGTSKQVQSIFWSYLSQDAADQGGMGLWKDIYRQLERGAGETPARGMGVSPMRLEGFQPSRTLDNSQDFPTGTSTATGGTPMLRSAGETPASRDETFLSRLDQHGRDAHATWDAGGTPAPRVEVLK